MTIEKEYIFKITLENVPKRMLWRKVAAMGDQSLYQLAGAILDSFNFDLDHAFGFYSNVKNRHIYDSDRMYELFSDMKDAEHSEGAKGVEKTKIDQVWKKEKDVMLFMFDYGDDWRFHVELEKIQEAAKNKQEYPLQIEAKGEAPEQYPDYDEDE